MIFSSTINTEIGLECLNYNIDYVVVTFSGSGDSGSVDHVYFYGAQLKNHEVDDFPTVFENGGFVNEIFPEKEKDFNSSKIVTYLEDLATKYGNWWDDDGGRGVAIYSVKTSEVILSIDFAETVYTNETAIIPLKD